MSSSIPADLWQALSPFPGARGTLAVSEAANPLEHLCLTGVNAWCRVPVPHPHGIFY